MAYQPLKCPECDRPFGTDWFLDIHRANMHGVKSDDASNQSTSSQPGTTTTSTAPGKQEGSKKSFSWGTVIFIVVTVVWIAIGLIDEDGSDDSPARQAPVVVTAGPVATAAPAPTAAPAATVARPRSATDPAISQGSAEAGEILFNSNCSACHSKGPNTVVGPGLAGIAERAVGRNSLFVDDYLEQSIREPSAWIVDGFPPVMPSFAHLSDEDIQNLIAYLRTLN